MKRPAFRQREHRRAAGVGGPGFSCAPTRRASCHLASRRVSRPLGFSPRFRKMAKPKPWLPTPAEQSLLVDLVTARMPRAGIAARLGISELKLRRFEARLVSAREGMPPADSRPARAPTPRGDWLDRLFGDS